MDEKKTHILKISRSLDTELSHSIACCICGEADTIQGMREIAFAESLYKDGWRYGTSERYGCEGAMCPECARKDDSER